MSAKVRGLEHDNVLCTCRAGVQPHNFQ
jgi:hypothetical protein